MMSSHRSSSSPRDETQPQRLASDDVQEGTTMNDWELLASDTDRTRSPSLASVVESDWTDVRGDDCPRSPVHGDKEKGNGSPVRQALASDYDQLTIEETGSSGASALKRQREPDEADQAGVKDPPERASTPKAARRRRHETNCELCGEQICGERWACKECPAWNLCSMCINLALCDNEVHPGHTLMRVLQPYDVIQLAPKLWEPVLGCYIPTPPPVIHTDAVCTNCDRSVLGALYECAVADCRKEGVLLCQDCEALPINGHPPSHPLIKYKFTRPSSKKIAISTSQATPKEAKQLLPKEELSKSSTTAVLCDEKKRESEGGNTVRIVPSAPSQNVTKLPLTGPMQSLVCHMAAKALQTFTGEENLTKEALDIVPLGKGTMCFQP